MLFLSFNYITVSCRIYKKLIRPRAVKDRQHLLGRRVKPLKIIAFYARLLEIFRCAIVLLLRYPTPELGILYLYTGDIAPSD